MKHEKLRASLMHKCKKCLVDYLLNGQEESQSGAALMGTLIHNGFIPYYEKIIGRRIVYREKALENEYFTGHIDGYIKAEQKLFELKTVNGWKFNSIKEPLDNHITQMHIYMKMLNTTKTHIVYLNRDTGEHKAFDIDFYPIIYIAVEQKAIEAIKLAKEGASPEDIVLSEFETCDNYCKFGTNAPILPKPEDEKESSEIEGLKDLFEERMKLYSEEKEVSERRKELEAKIKELMSKHNAKKIIDLGITFVQSTRNTFDSKTFKVKHPDLYNEFLKQSISQSLRFPKI